MPSLLLHLTLFPGLRLLPKPREEVIMRRGRGGAPPEHIVVPRRRALHPRHPVKDVVVLVVHWHGRVLRLGRRRGGRCLERVEDGVDGGRRRGAGLGRDSRPEEAVVRGRGGRRAGRRGGSGIGPRGSGGRRGAGGRHGRGLPLRAQAEVAGQQALEVIHGPRGGHADRRILVPLPESGRLRRLPIGRCAEKRWRGARMSGEVDLVEQESS
jgi:hypothetical protein